jgi:MFS family permease
MGDPMNTGKLTQRGFGAAYPLYVVGVLLVAYILSFMDRTVMSLLIDPIRRDLALTDTSIGVLVGFGFVIVYSIAGLGLGRLADLKDRRVMIAVGMLIWSAATSASALSTGFMSLLAARILVGVGEASLSPASYSLIASYFRKERLGFATSVYALGTVLGSGIAAALIGGVAHLVGRSTAWFDISPGSGNWRLIFLAVGALGLPFVVLMFTIREPRAPAAKDGFTLYEAFEVLREHRRVFGGIMIGYAVMTIVSFTAVLWGPTYFIRLHGDTPGSIGSLFGVVMGIGGSAGVLVGGLLTDRLTRRGVLDAPPRVVVLSLLSQTVLFPAAYLSSTRSMAVGFFAAGIFFMAFQGGLQGASIAVLAHERMRGLTMAAYLLLANMIGMGCGPLIVGLITDHVFHSPLALGKSLAIVAVSSSLLAIAILIPTLQAFRQFVSGGGAHCRNSNSGPAAMQPTVPASV